MGDDDKPTFPIRTHRDGEPIPDLAAIPEAARLDALRPLSPLGRELAIDLARTRIDALAIGELILALPSLRSRPNTAVSVLHAGPSLPSAPAPDGQIARDHASGVRQVSFRLSPAQYAELQAAADDVNLRPAPLARLLVLNGVRRMAYEARRGATDDSR